MSAAGSRPISAIRLHEHGDRDVLRLESVELPPPAPDEAQVRHTRIGVNYSDVNIRRGGFYPPEPPLLFPSIIGNEAVGVIESVGSDVTDFEVGDRVGYVKGRGVFFADLGSYAEARNIPAERLVRLPDFLTDDQVASVLLKGLTAAAIIHRFHTPRPGEVILNHAAASGVGLLLTAWAAHLGATVIGTTSTEAKAALARSQGAAHTILYRDTSFVEAVREIVPQGVDVVFDGVGKDTFLRSMDAMRPFGKLINYGNASGPVPPLDIFTLALKGSIWVNRAGVELVDLEFYRQGIQEIFEFIRAGVMTVHTHEVYPLSEAAAAHADLEAVRTSGSILLRP